MKKTATKHSFRIGKSFSVDRKAGALTGLSLMTAGREAKGHGIYIDARTLQTGLDSVAGKGGQLKAYIRHSSIMDILNVGGDRLMKAPGYFSDISIKNDQLIAGRFDFYDTFKESEPDAYNRLLEMAEKTPDLFGLSVEVWGYSVFVDSEGNEFGKMPEDGEDGEREWQYDGMPALRITDLDAAAFVSEPAANDGLFARFAKIFSTGQPDEVKELRELGSAVLRWLQKEEDGESSLPTPPPSKDTNLSSSDEIMNKTLEAIRQKFSATPEKFSQAMVIFGNKPEATIESIEAEMQSAELSSLKTQVTDLQTKLSTAETERDDWKEKFEKLKGSGLDEERDLGAGGGEGGAKEENPFVTKNLTAQAKLLKSDPKKYAAMKTAASAA